MKISPFFGVVTLLATGLGMADDKPAGSSDQPAIEIIDSQGAKHVVTQCIEDRKLYRSGTPFDTGISFDSSNVPLLNTLVAFNVHPASRDEIAASENRNQAVYIIPILAIEDVTFTSQQKGNSTVTSSTIRLPGIKPLEAGAGFGHLVGKENLGALGTADFDVWLDDGVKEIKSRAPTHFAGDFSFFGTTESPFTAKIMDVTGTEIILDKALFCEDVEETVPRQDGYMGDSTDEMLGFHSKLNATKGETSKLSIDSSKLSEIKLVKETTLGFDANITLRGDKTFNLTITPLQGPSVQSGILGYSARGWIWVPWRAISSVEFYDK